MGYIVALQEEYENHPSFTDEVMDYHVNNWEIYINELALKITGIGFRY